MQAPAYILVHITLTLHLSKLPPKPEAHDPLVHGFSNLSFELLIPTCFVIKSSGLYIFSFSNGCTKLNGACQYIGINFNSAEDEENSLHVLSD